MTKPTLAERRKQSAEALEHQRKYADKIIEDTNILDQDIYVLESLATSAFEIRTVSILRRLFDRGTSSPGL